MSIAIKRIKRAIADMPTGGMQTGKRHTKLEYSDAQRAITEIEGLTAERDALAAQVEVVRHAWEAVKSTDYDKILDEALELTPAACLAQIKAEAVDAAASSLEVFADNFQTSSCEFKHGIQAASAYLSLRVNRIRQEVE